jgi:endonuclease-3 related protein
MTARGTLPAYYRALRRRFGPQHWWPGETPFEVMVGAVLTQNTSWKNVERAIAALKAAGALEPRTIHAMSAPALAALIRPAGYFRVKARRLKSLVAWFVGRAGGRVERLADVPTDALRAELLQVHGVGPETADSILLYALERPVFVIDQYTWRVLSRHGWVPEETGYEEMRELMESKLKPDVPLWNDFHAQLVRVGHEFCRPTPRCEECPLKRWLP